MQFDDKQLPLPPTVSFVSRAGRNDLRVTRVSPDLGVMLIGSICFAAFNYVDVSDHHGDKTYGVWRACFDSCVCE